jgi:uncharacterized surface protein with fasciclin (FAS1) repeats
LNIFNQLKLYYFKFFLAILLFSGCVAPVSLPEAKEQTLWLNLQGKPDYSSLVFALQRTELHNLLQNNGPVTLFAPNNEAFSLYLNDQLVNNLAAMPLADLRNLLLFHMIPGRLLFKNMQSASIPTLLSGQSLNLTVSKDGVLLDRRANIVLADQDGINGTIHFIDKVLTPEN